ncbi:hypothetical protein BGX23_005511, partial [Mortierella sp. AD031]
MTSRPPSEIRSSGRRFQRPVPQLQQQQQHQPPLYQQQQQHYQSSPHQQQPYQHQSFLFDTDFDLVGPLGGGFLAGASAGNTSLNDHSNNSNHNSINNGSGRGHVGGTSSKSSASRSTPLTPAKPNRADRTDRTDTKFDPIASATGHNMSSFLGASDDPLKTTDADFQPYFVDFGGSGSIDRAKRSVPSAIGRELKKPVASPLQTPQPQESSSLGMLDDIFQPTLGFAAAPSRPAVRAFSSREKHQPQQQQQQQQQQQPVPPPPPQPLQRQTQQQLSQQQQHLDSSLDFFSSLDTISPCRSTTTSSRTSPSGSFAHLNSNAPLPSFPSIPTDYSAFGRNSTARKATPVRKPSQSSSTSSTSTKNTESPLETISSTSSPLSALADVFVSTKGSELRSSPSPATSTSSTGSLRRRSDASTPLSASVTSSRSSSSASAMASSAVSSTGQAVSKTPPRSTSSSSRSSTASSPSASPSLAPVAAPPKPVPKMPARILNPP